ncbi:MAG: lysophospholipid acyltransferase family protein [Paracoccaceae bacterium]
MRLRVRASPLLRRAAAALGALWIRLVERTTRWEVEGGGRLAEVQGGRTRTLVLVWHGRVLMIPAEWREGLEIHAMISANRDGDIIADCVGRFGVPSIRGSARDPRKTDRDKGGRAAAQAALALLTAERPVSVAITPDGPRGPRQRLQPGVAAIAALAGVPAMPYAYSTRWGWRARSWDRFHVPLPFGRGAKVIGDLVPPPAEATPEAVEAHRAALEAALNAVTDRADRLVGREPTRPAEARPAAVRSGQAPAA